MRSRLIHHRRNTARFDPISVLAKRRRIRRRGLAVLGAAIAARQGAKAARALARRMR